MSDEQSQELKPDNGVYVRTVNETRVDIDGRMDGSSPIRVVVEHGKEPIFQIVSVKHLNLAHAREFQALLRGVIEAVEMATAAMNNAHGQEGGGK